jgi:hypothetical protein
VGDVIGRADLAEGGGMCQARCGPRTAPLTIMGSL